MGWWVVTSWVTDPGDALFLMLCHLWCCGSVSLNVCVNLRDIFGPTCLSYSG